MASRSGSPPELSAASTTSRDSSRSRRRFGLGRKGRSLSSSSFTRQSRRNSKDSHSAGSTSSSIETSESRRRFGLGRKVRSLSASPFQRSKKGSRSSPPKQIVSETKTNIVAAQSLSHDLPDNYLPKTLISSSTKTPKISNSYHTTTHYYSPPRRSPRKIVYYTEDLPPLTQRSNSNSPNLLRFGLVVFALVFGLLVGGNILWMAPQQPSTTDDDVVPMDPKLAHRLNVIQYETGL